MSRATLARGGRGSEAGRARRLPGPELVGRVLLAAGLILLAAFAGDVALGLWQEHELDGRWRAQVAAHPPPAAADPRLIRPYPVDGVDFAIRVPKIGYLAAVAEGVDARTLAAGPGHYPDTAWPGRPGNVGVAAHNVYWIRFGDLKPGDQVMLDTRWGTYTYRVTGTRIVRPDDRTVLVQAGPPRLTLTTCWPLWAGAFANRRLVIFTDQFDPPAAGT